VTPSERLKVAGEAAEILESLGYTAVARLSDGTVTLEFWRLIGRTQHLMRHIVGDEMANARLMAESCAAEFRAAVDEGRLES
jgi:hypothetical protein